MANGKHGDHPVSDILDHGLEVFSPEADALVRDLARLVPRYRLLELVDWFAPPPLDVLTARLRELRDQSTAQARDRGWEVR